MTLPEHDARCSALRRKLDAHIPNCKEYLDILTELQTANRERLAAAQLIFVSLQR